MKYKNLLFILIMIILIFNTSICYATETDEPEIIAEAAILMDSSTEKILFSKNENQIMYPASTTKILTAILVLENCKLDDIVTVPYEAIITVPSGYTIASLQAGEQLTVNDLLQLMLVHSSNDAANVLAFHVSGSIEAFSVLMNKKVEELGLKNTHFVNPSGIHDKEHVSTAYDLAVLMKYCMQNSTFRSLSSLKYCKIPATNKFEERVFDTTNELLRYDNRNVSSNYYYKYAIAGKTGYTTDAKNCLVSVSNKDGLELICVILGSGLYPNNLSGRFIDTKAVFDYGYNNYINKKIRDRNAIAEQIVVKNATKETKNLDLLISSDITALVLQKNYDNEFTPEIQINDNLTAPISQGTTVGKIIYNIDGIEYSSDLIASHSVKKSGFLTLFIQIVMVILILYFLYNLLFGDKKRHKDKKKHKNSNFRH